MSNRTRTGLLILVLTAGLAGCGGTSPQAPTGPSTVQPPPPPPSGFPPGVFSDYILSGVVFETTAAGRSPIEGVGVYCELCGTDTHSWASTDSDGFYSFTGIWNAGVGPTPLYVEKAEYVDPPGPPSPGPGWRSVTITADTRFDIELVRR